MPYSNPIGSKAYKKPTQQAFPAYSVDFLEHISTSSNDTQWNYCSIIVNYIDISKNNDIIKTCY